MGLLSRLGNVFRGEKLNSEIQEEMDAHLAEAVAQGRDPVEARRAFGSVRKRSARRVIRCGWWVGWIRCGRMWCLDGGS